MSRYSIKMCWTGVAMYDTYEDEQGHHSGTLYEEDKNDEPFYRIVDDETGEWVEDFNDYKLAKHYIKKLIRERGE